MKSFFAIAIVFFAFTCEFAQVEQAPMIGKASASSANRYLIDHASERVAGRIGAITEMAIAPRDAGHLG